MPVGEITAAITSLRATLDITKAMVGLRDTAAFQKKSIELQTLILEAIDKNIASAQAQAMQLEEIGALKAKVARLEAWDREKERYELKKLGHGGAVAYMLKPNARGSEPPHWLCPNCYGQSKKSFLQPTGEHVLRHLLYRCGACRMEMPTPFEPKWID